MITKRPFKINDILDEPIFFEYANKEKYTLVRDKERSLVTLRDFFKDYEDIKGAYETLLAEHQELYEYKRRDRVYQKATYTGEKAEYRRAYYKNKYQEQLRAEGKQTEKEKISCRRAKIKDLLAEGLKQKDICIQLDISKRTCLYDIKYLKEHGLI